MLRTVTGLALGLASGILAQAPARFEVASVKPGNAAPGSPSGIKTGNGQLDGRNVTLKRCIIGAYGVGPNQIVGGPNWLDSDRFEILAKAAEPINDDAVLMVMLRDVLADRFKLSLHRETRTLPAYVLEIAKNGPKLKRAEGGPSVTNTSSSNVQSSIDARNTSMDALAQLLSRKADLPVIDQTGLEGLFDFELHWAPDNAKLSDTGDASLFTAIQEQLGLRLRSEKAPVEVLVIDHAEKPSGD